MKKMLSLGVILLFFGLVLAPSINGNNDIEILNRKNVNSVIKIKELSKKLLEIRINLNKNDCGCNEESSRWGFPIICSVLGVFWLILMILVISMNQNQFLDLLEP